MSGEVHDCWACRVGAIIDEAVDEGVEQGRAEQREADAQYIVDAAPDKSPRQIAAAIRARGKAGALSPEERVVKARAEERERLHTLLEACHAAIDPEGHEELVARLMAEFDSPGCQCADLRERVAAEEREAIAAWHDSVAAHLDLAAPCAGSPEECRRMQRDAEIHEDAAAAIRARGKAEEVKP